MKNHDEFKELWKPLIPKVVTVIRLLKITEDESKIQGLAEQIAWEMYLKMRPQRN
jgi:hypothetical protein